MDTHPIDRAARIVGSNTSRRGALMLGLALLLTTNTVAKKKRKRKGNKQRGGQTSPPPVVPPPLVFNEFGCVNVGLSCNGDGGNCCSGICNGPAPIPGQPDTSRCVAHHVSTCQPGQDAITGEAVWCNDDFPGSWASGYCYMTTGNASFCGRVPSGRLPCKKDSECIPRTCEDPNSPPPVECYTWPGAACVKVRNGQAVCTIAPMGLSA